MWVHSLAVLLVVLSVSSSTDLQHEFHKFMQDHGKTYGSADEYLKRYTIWLENRDLIRRHNEEAANGLQSYIMDMNQFGDMTREEFKSLMLTLQPNSNRQPASDPCKSSVLPDSVDWKEKGYVTEVGNQGQCGSCWAFTATGALEGAHKKKTGKLVDLSEQNLMDCSKKQGNLGCNGGLMDFSYTYVKENGGIDTESSYPYDVKNPHVGKCKFNTTNVGATCTGYVDLPKGNETSLQCAVADVGPIGVAVDASRPGFEFYKSGVYDDPGCNPEGYLHSLVVVGYGTLDGKQYYNCKNSWGTAWGDQGYIKMVRNKQNQCGIASEASYPTV